MKGEEYFKELISGKRRGIGDRILLALLMLGSVPYAAFMRMRAVGYSTGIIPSLHLPRPVISVGNITMGGTGKTPAVLLVARLLMERGKRVAVLTRGYNGSLEGETRIVSDGAALLLTPEEAGDEPCLLASSLPGLIVVMGTDRYRAGSLAMERLSPDMFILDDGFQHQRLRRDLDILLLDSAKPFANARTLPAGILREPPASARRADLILFTRCPKDVTHRDDMVAGIPQCSSSHRLTGWVPLAGGKTMPLDDLKGRRAVAFAGIADPRAFFESLEEEGVPLVATLAFPDHTCYGPREMKALGLLKNDKRADCLITTAKDAVKLQPYRGIMGDCCVAQMELHLHDSAQLVLALEKL